MEIVDDAARRRELGEFLRSRRQRLTPEDAGVAWGRRRRTPGLRREDVAELAGIGTAWYTWLEQARDISPSQEALRRIARALKLDPTEELYFLELALGCRPTEYVPDERTDELVPAQLQHILEAFKGPAYVRGRRWDLLAFNRICDVVFGYGDIADGNLVRNLFRPESRALYPEWAAVAQRLVAMFRADCAGMMQDPWVRRLVDQMTETSEEFRIWWGEHAVQALGSGHFAYDHPEIGRLVLNFTNLQAGDRSNLRLVAFLPDDDDSRERIAELVERKRHH